MGPADRIVNRDVSSGGLAQLGERLAGSQEVRGSSPLSSTSERSSRLGGVVSGSVAVGSAPAVGPATSGDRGGGVHLKLVGSVLCLLGLTLVASAASGGDPDVLQARPWSQPRPPVRHVVVIDLEGPVSFGLYAAVKRRTREALALEPKPDLLIYHIDTYGGTLDSALKIVEVIGEVDEPLTVAYIPKKAISAGALIALSTRQMVMGPGAKIGDAQPIIPSTEGMTPAGEKIETVLRATFRSLAERNGYPVTLAEAMVSARLEVHKVAIEGEAEPRYVRAEQAAALKQQYGEKMLSDEVVVPEGELLTMFAREAYDFGFARALVADEAGLLAYYGASQAQVTRLGTSWSEDLVRFLDAIGPLLLVAGLLGLYLEFKSPGFGLPGIVGIMSLTLYFGSKYLVGLADVADILVFFIGVSLLAVELFIIPGFGVIGVAGILLILTGMLLSFQSFVVPQSPAEVSVLGWSFVQLLGVLTVVVVGAGLLGRYLHAVPLVRGLVLTTEPTPVQVHSSAAPGEHRLAQLVGAVGLAVTYCRPAGKAAFGERLVDVVAQGEYIERGREVQVVALEGNRVVVREVPGAEPDGEEEV